MLDAGQGETDVGGRQVRGLAAAEGRDGDCMRWRRVTLGRVRQRNPKQKTCIQGGPKKVPHFLKISLQSGAFLAADRYHKPQGWILC